MRFENVSKRYTLHHQRIQGLRDVLPYYLSRFTKNSIAQKTRNEEFFALKDASFEIKRGEALGVIGPNGAGKTTILKLLAGIIEPTQGRVVVEGKVAALIEIGAGFHGDLTGRENIYLYGSIMGLRKRDIEEKFDSILAFSELEPFIDTPIKHYSSGMYARLGFSVAAHVNPDIILVDEVLAVGDMHFQRKCHQKMEEIRQSNRVIVFVSHSLPAVESLCSRALWLDHGIIRELDSTKKVIAAYINETNRRQMEQTASRDGNSERKGSGEVRITKVQITGADSIERNGFFLGEDIVIRMQYSASKRIFAPSFGISVWSDEGLRICTINTKAENVSPEFVEGVGTICCTLKNPRFLPRLYFVRVAIDDAQGKMPYDLWDKAGKFRIEVQQDAAKGNTILDGSWGIVHVPNTWHLENKDTP